ncbi:MAG: APC family permease [Planctomycetota bacterium]
MIPAPKGSERHDGSVWAALTLSGATSGLGVQECDAAGNSVNDFGAWLSVLLIVINGLIGAGIFGLPEALHQAVGTFAPWLLLLGGALVMAITVCFAELARLTDRSGGPQRFVGDAFGDYPGFVVGWTFFSARLISQGANLLVLAAYAAAVWPALAEGPVRTAVRIAAAKPAGPITLPSFSAVEGVALAALYAFVGFENATVPGGEARDPRRSMPRALPLGLALVTLLYFGLQLAYSHSPIAGTDPEAPLAAELGGDVGALLMGLTVVVSLLANRMAGHAQRELQRLLPRL